MWNSLLIILVLSCSHRSGDPLANTKKLVKEGHVSLYQNGAFKIPTTKIKLIPPGPDALAFAKELSGVSAKASFERYLKEIANQYVTVYEGHKKTYSLARKVDKDIDKELNVLSRKLRKSSSLVLRKTFSVSSGFIGESINVAKVSFDEVSQAGEKIVEKTSGFRLDSAKFDGINSFVNGYVVFPEKLEKVNDRVKEKVSFNNYVQDFSKSSEFRENWSGKTTYLIKDSFSTYENDVSKKISHAGSELSKSNEYGFTLQAMKSLVSVLDAILWEGVLKPVGKVTSGAVGYVMVNAVAYPVVLMTKSGTTTLNSAVEVVSAGAKSSYYLVAPTVELALSGLLYSGEVIYKTAAEKTVQGGGFLLGNGTKYIAAPVTAGSMASAYALSGVAVGISGATLAGSTKIAAETANLSSRTISFSTASGLYAGGMTYHLTKAVGESAYEIIKAATVPPGMILGSGLTLSYGTLSQLGAQSILAVSDAAYLVLSLEGPNWVIYAVKGGPQTNEIPANTILDLEKIQSDGAEVIRVPVDEENLKNVIENLDSEL